jgi:hypothetical protein
MDFEDGPSRLEGFALYLNSYFVGVIGLVAVRYDGYGPILVVAGVVAMFFLPLAVIGFALMPLAARRVWYFARLAVALAIVLTVVSPTLPAYPRKSEDWSYIAGIRGLLAVSAVIRAAALTASLDSNRGSSTE